MDTPESNKRLAESDLQYRRLVDAVVDYAIFQLDRSGIVTTWNSGASRIKGYSSDEIIGQHFSCFYTEEDRTAGIPELALRTAADIGKYQAEGERVRKDGSRFFALVVIDAIRNEQGNVVGFAKVTRDITERVKVEQALRETQEQLSAAQKMEAVGQLSGGIAHDFNNLLMIVIGNLETALRHVNQSKHSNLPRLLGNAMRGAQRAAALTSKLLAFSRRQPLDPRPLDVNKVISGAVDFLQRSLGENVRVEAVGAAGLWPIEVDPNHLDSALVNLAINARDAMPDGGKLTIEAANVYLDSDYCRVNPEISPGQFVVVSVSDTGTGMAADVLGRAFEPFFTTKEPGHGTGLGLSQVYGFVKQSAGHVKIYSEVDQGTTIKLYFPRYRNQSASEEKESEQAVEEGDDGNVILVVEDDDHVRLYLADVLRELKYRVLSVPNADAALAIFEAGQRVDLMLTDIVMPGKDGRALAREVERLRPSLPILYMSGYSRNAIVHQGRLDEGIEFLQKPISQAVLSRRVSEMLDRR